MTVLPRTPRPRRITTAFLCALTALLAAPLAHAEACSTTQTQPFLAWGDLSKYVLIPGGALEPASTHWTLKDGAALVAGNEPYHVHKASDAHSLSLPSGSLARTAKVCMELTAPTLRFFVTNTGASTSRLLIQVLFRNGLAQLLGKADVARIGGSATWEPTPIILVLANLTVPVGTKYVQLTFSPTGTGGAWRIDDVYVDPWISR